MRVISVDGIPVLEFEYVGSTAYSEAQGIESYKEDDWCEQQSLKYESHTAFRVRKSAQQTSVR